MSEIIENEYVRTEEGYILKNTALEHEYIIEQLERNNDEYIKEFGKIVKHSKDIIDLIEVEDIVKVLDIDLIRILKLDNQEEVETFREELQEENYKLLSILTHERYEQNCYEIDTN